MLALLESHGHWGYIYVSLAVTLVLVLADLLPPFLRQRQLQAEVRARVRREQQRNESE